MRDVFVMCRKERAIYIINKCKLDLKFVHFIFPMLYILRKEYFHHVSPMSSNIIRFCSPLRKWTVVSVQCSLISNLEDSIQYLEVVLVLFLSCLFMI